MAHTIAKPCSSELLIKKSRFIACVQAVADRAAAQKVVAALWAQHPTATHVCWALMAAGILRRWMTVNPAAPPDAPCWMSCGTRT